MNPEQTPGKIQSYRDLVVWRRAVDLVADTYRLTARLPARETYGLSSQMQRAATSVPANIAEGHGRRSTGEFLHHLSIANGSLKELETHLIVAVRLGYVQQEEIEPLLRESDEIGRMLTALMRSLRDRRKTA